LPKAADSDLAALAKAHRMNTPARRAAFEAVAGAADADDAATRVNELRRLKRCDDGDAATVLVALCAAEKNAYNPFYAAVARKLCTSRGFPFALKLAFWDALRPTGGALDDVARPAANVGKLLAACLSADLPLAAALGRVAADALAADARVCVLVAAALRALIVDGDDARFDAALAPPDRPPPSFDALLGLLKAQVAVPPAFKARHKRLRRFLADPARPSS